MVSRLIDMVMKSWFAVSYPLRLAAIRSCLVVSIHAKTAQPIPQQRMGVTVVCVQPCLTGYLQQCCSIMYVLLDYYVLGGGRTLYLLIRDVIGHCVVPIVLLNEPVVLDQTLFIVLRPIALAPRSPFPDTRPGTQVLLYCPAGARSFLQHLLLW